MAKRPFVEFILLVINMVFTLWGLGTLGYGLFCFVKWKQEPPKDQLIHGINGSNAKYMVVAHRLLLAIDPHKPLSDSLPKAWFIYLLIGIGAILFIISCFGYVGTASRSPCCLLSYSVLLIATAVIELGSVAFIFLKDNWVEVIPKDSSGSFHSVYNFLNDKWKIIRWIALGVFVLQVIAMILALYLRAVLNRAWYDPSDDEHVIYLPRSAASVSASASARTQTQAPNYRNRKTAPISSSTPLTTTTHSASPLDPTTNANANGRDPTNPRKVLQ